MRKDAEINKHLPRRSSNLLYNFTHSAIASFSFTLLHASLVANAKQNRAMTHTERLQMQSEKNSHSTSLPPSF